MERITDKIIYDERNIKRAMQNNNLRIPLHFYKKTASTIALAKKSKLPYSLIVAKMQTDGVGRKDRKFVSHMGGIYFSYSFKPNLAPKDATLCVIFCGIAIIRALKKFGINDAKLKWPNDIYIGNKKICGILSQVITTFDSIEKLIMSVGLNVDNQIEKEVSKASNLKNIYGRNFDKNDMLCKIILAIEEVLDEYYKYGFAPLKEEYLENCNFIGKKVEVIENGRFEAIAKGIDKRGFLVVDVGEEKTVISGDVTLII